MSDFPSFRRLWLPVAVALCAILILPVVMRSAEGWVYPDSVSYMDMASGAIAGSPTVLLKNAYWSPAFPALLALMMAVVHPSLNGELHAMYAVQWMIFVLAAACFGLLVVNFLRRLRAGSWPELENDRALCRLLTVFAFGLFLFLNMSHIIWFLTPDMLLQAMVYLSAAWAVRLFLPDSGWRHSAALGMSLGIGYLAKAAMFPVALILSGILFLKPPKDNLGRRHVAIALLCFAITASPLVIGLSLEKHRFTFGDAGKLNYAFVVTKLGPFSGWIGQNPENGVPAHAPRVLNLTPMVLEFRSPVPGTLPIWYDPSYWWEGVRIPLDVRREIEGILRPFGLVHAKSSLLLALLALLAPLALLDRRVRRALATDGVALWILIVWPALACLMYTLVLFSLRYVIAYMVVSGIGATAIALQPFGAATKRKALLAGVVLLAAGAGARMVPILRDVLKPGSQAVFTVAEDKDYAPTAAAIAHGLHELGIRPGDEIAMMGYDLDAYYARLAGVRVVAQVWEDPTKIANLGDGEVRRILDGLKRSGVKALLSRTATPGFVNDQGWVAIPNTAICVRML